MITAAQALSDLEAQADAAKAAEMAVYHQVQRPYLGVTVPVIDNLATGWRAACTLDDRLALAADLWRSNIHEARVAAAKLLTQARIRPDDAAWALIQTWVPDFDGWALADHACTAGQKRLMADPQRLDTVEAWTTSDHMWTRRAALGITLPFTKSNNPKPAEHAARDRILGWAAAYATDHDRFIQKAVAEWVSDLSKHDAPRAQAFLAAHGAQLKPFAAKEAARYIGT